MGHFRFAAVGDNCVDRFQAPINQSLIGGNAVNVAVQLARLGHSSFYFGAVGKDVDGERTTRALKDNGVETSCLQLRPGNTAYTNIEQTASGDRIIAYEDFGTCAGYRPSEEDIAVLKTMDHVHLGWLDDAGELRRRLSSEGVSLSQDISVNANPENLGVAGLTVAFASAGARGAPADSLLSYLLANGAACAVVTCGSDGALARRGEEFGDSSIAPVTVVDTTGAGDSFIAGFLAAFVAQQPLVACLEQGRDCAAITCTHVGGFPQQPLPL